MQAWRPGELVFGPTSLAQCEAFIATLGIYVIVKDERGGYAVHRVEHPVEGPQQAAGGPPMSLPVEPPTPLHSRR